MDAFSILKKDHQKARMLFERIEADESVSEREDQFNELQELLMSHSELEEMVLYPMLEDKELTTDLAEASYDDHEDMRDLLDQLDMMEKTDPEWISLFRQLRETVEHHTEEEESELFPKARKALSRYELEDLSNQILQKKKHTGIVEIINDLVT
ncbi:MAG: hemerythrin domain-containing protein [Candidatus Altimarinota bacterium]